MKSVQSISAPPHKFPALDGRSAILLWALSGNMAVRNSEEENAKFEGNWF